MARRGVSKGGITARRGSMVICSTWDLQAQGAISVGRGLRPRAPSRSAPVHYHVLFINIFALCSKRQQPAKLLRLTSSTTYDMFLTVNHGEGLRGPKASLPVSLGTIHVEPLSETAPHHLPHDAAHAVHDGIPALISEVKHLDAENTASENDHFTYT